MKENDDLFLYQLLIPMCSFRKSGIRKDPQKDFYSEVEKWSNIYESQLSLGESDSRNSEKISIGELVQWGGFLIRGALATRRQI